MWHYVCSVIILQIKLTLNPKSDICVILEYEHFFSCSSSSSTLRIELEACEIPLPQ